MIAPFFSPVLPSACRSAHPTFAALALDDQAARSLRGSLLEVVEIDGLAGPRRFDDAEDHLHRLDVVPPAADRFLAGSTTFREVQYLVHEEVGAGQIGATRIDWLERRMDQFLEVAFVARVEVLLLDGEQDRTEVPNRTIAFSRDRRCVEHSVPLLPITVYDAPSGTA